VKLEVIIASTRPGRIGDQVGKWIADYAKANSDFEVSVADLVDYNLPLFDEPNHPRMAEYTKDHTKRWSKTVKNADAFIIVTPEYNYTMPPSLLNAIDYLHNEWAYKPAGVVAYGGSGGVRAAQTLRLVLSNLNVMPIPQMVNLVGVHAGATMPIEIDKRYQEMATILLNELELWSEALKGIRQRIV
jgi:NAD(P)H-dependent FMN reductase